MWSHLITIRFVSSLKLLQGAAVWHLVAITLQHLSFGGGEHLYKSNSGLRDILDPEVLLALDSPRKSGRSKELISSQNSFKEDFPNTWHQDVIQVFDACTKDIAQPPHKTRKHQIHLWISSFLKGGRNSNTWISSFHQKEKTSSNYLSLNGQPSPVRLISMPHEGQEVYYHRQKVQIDATDRCYFLCIPDILLVLN